MCFNWGRRVFSSAYLFFFSIKSSNFATNLYGGLVIIVSFMIHYSKKGTTCTTHIV